MDVNISAEELEAGVLPDLVQLVPTMAPTELPMILPP
jgi:hypothetical protein